MAATLVVNTSNQFDPVPLFEDTSERYKQVSDGKWIIEVADDLLGLTLIQNSLPGQFTAIQRSREIDRDGWEDWTDVGADEWEMTSTLLPTTDPNYIGANGRWGYRYVDAYVWDPAAPSLTASELKDYRLTESVPSNYTATGAGRWIFTGVKWGARVTGEAIVAEVAIRLLTKAAQKSWEKIQRDSVIARHQYERRDLERRTLINLADVRRKRLTTGPTSSRKKAEEYYANLDRIVRANM